MLCYTVNTKHVITIRSTHTTWKSLQAYTGIPVLLSVRSAYAVPYSTLNKVLGLPITITDTVDVKYVHIFCFPLELFV